MAKPNIEVLIEMHTYCRPMGSPAEDEFIGRFIKKLPGAEQDKFGNWHVQVGDNPTVLFSCHTDTVHSKSGRQKLHYNAGTGLLKLHSNSHSNCLGADDTAGVWICREMILAGIPGHYVFHYGEERGCKGSSAVTSEYPEFFKRFKAAIAFDRRDFGDVITHQSCGKSASDAFAQDLADKINATNHQLNYEPSDGGVYTDTAEYVDLIQECTNLSVGYQFEHRHYEQLYTYNTRLLLEAMLSIDFGSLVIERDVKDTGWRSRIYYGGSGWSSHDYGSWRNYSGESNLRPMTDAEVEEYWERTFRAAESTSIEPSTVIDLRTKEDKDAYDDLDHDTQVWLAENYIQASPEARKEFKEWLDPREYEFCEEILREHNELAEYEEFETVEADSVYLSSEIAQVQRELEQQLKHRLNKEE